MFGIGLPELIVILAVALIVVGPEKLPDLARTVARQLLELKKAANTFKDSIQDEMAPDLPDEEWQPIAPEQFSPESPAAEDRRRALGETPASEDQGGPSSVLTAADENRQDDPESSTSAR